MNSDGGAMHSDVAIKQGGGDSGGLLVLDGDGVDVLGEGVLDVVLARVVAEVADVHLQMIVDAEKRDRRVE